jgi:hypothetical protein
MNKIMNKSSNLVVDMRYAEADGNTAEYLHDLLRTMSNQSEQREIWKDGGIGPDLGEFGNRIFDDCAVTYILELEDSSSIYLRKLIGESTLGVLAKMRSMLQLDLLSRQDDFDFLINSEEMHQFRKLAKSALESFGT